MCVCTHTQVHTRDIIDRFNALFSDIISILYSMPLDLSVAIDDENTS